MSRWNWTPDPLTSVMIDLETQSPVNLKAVGGRTYLRHPATRLMCLVAKLGKLIIVWAPSGRWPGRDLAINPHDCWPDHMARDGEGIILYTGDEVPDILRGWIAKGHTFVAHNAAGFDVEAFDRLVAKPYHCDNPAAWYDTMPICRAAGLPAALDALGQLFLGTGKDAGKDALKLMYTAKVNKAGEVIYPIGTVPLWKSILRYNVKDVLLMDRVFSETLGYGEPDLLDVHCTINARGIAFDRSFLNRLVDLWSDAENYALGEVERMTDGKLGRQAKNKGKSNLRSVPQMKKWLEDQGLVLDSLNRKVLERMYEYPEEFFDDWDSERMSAHHAHVCAVLRMRQTVTRVGKGKLLRIAQVADPDGRVRDVLVVYGAHTGRFSSRGIQLHNMARGVSDLDVEQLLQLHRQDGLTLAAIREAAERCKDSPGIDEILSTVLRPVFRASPGNALAIADYAAIEGRGLAWVAPQASALQVYRDDGDPYCEMASVIYGRPITPADKMERQVGKVVVLGCGYSMSANKFQAFCDAMRIDLVAAGVTAEQCVEAYRNAHTAIAGELQGKYRKGGIWQKYGKAAMDAVKYRRTSEAGRCQFYMRDDALVIQLPSGRELCYRNARIENVTPPYLLLIGIDDPKPTIMYTHHHGWSGSLYGGLITENIVQAVCRDLLAESLIQCERANLPVVLHVHDEIVLEVPQEKSVESLAKLCEIMSTPPRWAEGFPVAVEGFTNPHYTKSPFRGETKIKAIDGRIVKQKVHV